MEKLTKPKTGPPGTVEMILRPNTILRMTLPSGAMQVVDGVEQYTLSYGAIIVGLTGVAARSAGMPPLAVTGKIFASVDFEKRKCGLAQSITILGKTIDHARLRTLAIGRCCPASKM